MAITDTIRRAGPYASNGAQTAFPFAFKVFRPEDLVVTMTEDGIEAEAVLEADYFVTLNGDQDSAPGGTVNFTAAPSGPSVTITSGLPLEQPAHFTNNGGFYPRVLNDSLDRLTILMQQMWERLGRAAVRPLDAQATTGYVAGIGLDGEIVFYPPGDIVSGDPALRLQLQEAEGSTRIGYEERTVADKLGDTVSIADFGAVAGDTGNQQAAIQAALNTGKNVLIPEGVFRVTGNLTAKSGQRIYGNGPNSVLHLVGAVSTGLFDAVGTQATPIRRVEMANFTMLGDCTFSGGIPSINNGDAVDFQFAEDCRFSGLTIKGFNANGIALANGHRNLITNCHIDSCGQQAGIYANAIDPEGNQIVGNRFTNCGRYNAIHLEGSAGTGLGEGKPRNTVIANNYVADSYGHGINIELAPGTVCTGNTVLRCGPGEEVGLDVGIFVFGSPNSSVEGNTVNDCAGYGITIAAGSHSCVVSGNTTTGNLGSLLITNSVRPGGPPVNTAENQAIGTNSFDDGPVVLAGDVSVRQRVTLIKGAAEAEVMQRLDSTNIQRLWLAPNGAILWREGTNVSDIPGGAAREWMREGVVALALTGAGQVKPHLPAFADNATAIAGGVGAGCLYRTATGEVRVVV